MRPTDAELREGLAVQRRLIDAYRAGKIADDEFRSIRLSYGLYYQLDHTSHMQRVKIPGGQLDAAQFERLAELTEDYGRGVAHVTTRQDIQFHWVPLESAMTIYERLHDVGITTRGACADSVRNVTACPYAGVHAEAPFDISPYVQAIHDYFLFNPLNLTLPRKFKIGVAGCPQDCAQAAINDIGLYARRGAEGEHGFAVCAAGGLGSQPYLARPIREFLPAAEVLVMCEAIVRVHHRRGERKNRRKARMKFLAQRLGAEAFRGAIEAEYARVDAERGNALRAELSEAVAAFQAPGPSLPGEPGEPPAAGAARRFWDTNTRPQRQAGYRAVSVVLPLGDITSRQMRLLAELTRKFGNGTLRTTNDQDLLLPWVPEARVPALADELIAIGLGETGALGISDVTSCPGADYCSLAISRSMGMAARIRAHLTSLDGNRALLERLGGFRVKVSGCPNACGQHQIGDIGLTGQVIKGPDGQEHPAYSVLVGGSVGADQAALGKRLVGHLPEEEVPRVVVALAVCFSRERHGSESFADFVERVGIERLGQVVEAIRAGAA